MTRAWFAVGFCVLVSCKLDSQANTSAFDVKPTPSRDLAPGSVRNHVPEPEEAGTQPASLPVAGRPQPAASGAERSTAGAQAITQARAAQAGAAATDAAQASAGGAGSEAPPAADAGLAPQGHAGAAGHAPLDSGAGASGELTPPNEPVDAGSQPPLMPADAATPADAAAPPVQDAAARPDATQADAGGGQDKGDPVLRDALRYALLQLLLNLDDADALGPDLAALIALLIADGALNPQLLAASLDLIASTDACHQDPQSENACAATCAGLAVQCKQCADDRACRNALQRVCGQQIRVDRCQ